VRVDAGNVARRGRASLNPLAFVQVGAHWRGTIRFAAPSMGNLGGQMADSGEFLPAATTDRDAIRAESLYIGRRRAGEPVEPALWFNLAMQGTDG
jgi:hypothetical protein